MKYVIDDLEAVALALFDAFGTDQEEEAEKDYIKAENEQAAAFWFLMDQLNAGTIDAVKTEENRRLYYTFTKSAQKVGAVQKTTWTTDEAGDPLPLSHCDIYVTARNADEITPGTYETITY